MIKIFGKIRYHWQPELSWAIIYWSLTLTPIFFSLSLLFERTQVPFLVFILLFLFLLFLVFGFHRFFTINDKGQILISDANPFAVRRIEIASIKKVEVTHLSVTFVTQTHPKGKIYYMRKWPKKYFLDALALNPYFKGEVELVDHLIKLDYFEVYKEDRKSYL